MTLKPTDIATVPPVTNSADLMKAAKFLEKCENGLSDHSPELQQWIVKCLAMKISSQTQGKDAVE